MGNQDNSPFVRDEASRLAIESFKAAVHENDSGAIELWFRTNSSLAPSVVNEPLFSFDTPALVLAASRGNRELVDVLLAHGADIQVKSRWWAGGFGVLHHDHDEMAHYLIERGAQVDAHAAARLGMLETLKQMLWQDPSVVNLRGPDGQVPLHFATSPEIIDLLLDHGAHIDKRDIDHGSTPAQWAIQNPDKCRYLLSKGAEADIFIACMLGDVELIRRLMEADPTVLHARVGQGRFTSGDSDGGHIYLYTIGGTARPIHLAASMNHQAAVEWMRKHCSTEQKLLLACAQADQAAVQSILSTYPDILSSLSPEEQSLIAEAAWDNRIDAVRTMLEAGFDVDAHVSKQSSALNRAAVRGYLPIVQLLLAHGASVTARNEFGGTPLSACIWGSVHFRDPHGDYPAVAACLIQAGADLPDQASGSPAVHDVLVRHGVPEV